MKQKNSLWLYCIYAICGGFLWGFIYVQSNQTVSATDTSYQPTNYTNKIKTDGNKGKNRSLQGIKTTNGTGTGNTGTNKKNTGKKTRASLKEFGLVSFGEIKKNFTKDDEVRIKYIAWTLYTEGYCKIKKICLNIGLVGNAIIRAEGGNKTIYGTSIYHNPFHIKYCMKSWIDRGWAKQGNFCIFKNYKTAIIAWWRMWEANNYNSNSIRTAIKYTGMDKPYHWLRIIRYYKNKFSYLKE